MKPCKAGEVAPAGSGYGLSMGAAWRVTAWHTLLPAGLSEDPLAITLVGQVLVTSWWGYTTREEYSVHDAL